MTVIEAVVFDMDGVLIDAREWHYESLNRALALFGFEIGRYEHLTAFDGLPTSKKLEMLSLEKGLPRGVHTLINRVKQRETARLVAQSCHPIFHHELTLSLLRRGGYRLAVASNSIRDTVLLMMRHAQLLEYLEFVLSNEDVEKTKPDPEMYLEAARRLEISPDRMLVVEDNHHGVQAAVASGAHVLRVNDPSEVTWKRLRAHLDILETRPR